MTHASLFSGIGGAEIAAFLLAGAIILAIIIAIR